MVAIGIGLHNLGEGLAIGSAYALGELALGAFLVIGFAIHNTTEGLAIVAPMARERRPRPGAAVGLGLIAGAPAILGAVIGAAAYNQELATFLLGVGVGAIIQVIGQLVPSIRDCAGRALHPLSIAGILAGAADPLRDRAAGEGLMAAKRRGRTPAAARTTPTASAAPPRARRTTRRRSTSSRAGARTPCTRAPSPSGSA